MDNGRVVELLIHAEAFRETCRKRGHNAGDVAKALLKRDFLMPDEKGNAAAKQVRIPGVGNARMYVISGKLTDDGAEEEESLDKTTQQQGGFYQQRPPQQGFQGPPQQPQRRTYPPRTPSPTQTANKAAPNAPDLTQAHLTSMSKEELVEFITSQEEGKIPF